MKDKKRDSIIKQRLLEICNLLNISARSFSISINMSPTYIASLNKDITSSVLNNISITYPHVNIMWLITGNGNPLRGDDEKSNADISFELKRLKLNHEELKIDYRKIMEELIICKERLKKYEDESDHTIEMKKFPTCRENVGNKNI